MRAPHLSPGGANASRGAASSTWHVLDGIAAAPAGALPITSGPRERRSKGAAPPARARRGSGRLPLALLALLAAAACAALALLAASYVCRLHSKAYPYAEPPTPAPLPAPAAPPAPLPAPAAPPAPLAPSPAAPPPAPRALPPRRLLLASHNQLAWYLVDSGELRVLHRGERVHYGIFPGQLPGTSRQVGSGGDDTRQDAKAGGGGSGGSSGAGSEGSVWSVVRPHNWRPASAEEHLVEFDALTGEELRRARVPSRFAHDAVRRGGTVYVCSTGDGALLELAYPSMELLRRLDLFTERDHPNTLAPLEPGGLWVVLHNRGKSDVVRVDLDLDPPRATWAVRGAGAKAHGLVEWGGALLALSSDEGALLALDPATGETAELWRAPEGGRFLKGLAVLDDVAYLGVSTWAPREIRGSPGHACEIAAYDLEGRRLLWRRRVETAGLLNAIAAPHLGEDSSYRAVYSLTRLPAGGGAGGAAARGGAAVAAEVAARLEQLGLGPMVTSYWSSGRPRMDLSFKSGPEPWAGGQLQLPLFLANVSTAQARLASLPAELWDPAHQAATNAAMTGRRGVMERFKPGVDTIVLMFSDQDAGSVYEFPYYAARFADVIGPLLVQILGEHDTRNVVRLQLARMRPGVSDIRMHQDAGGYALDAHRIHVPLITNPGVVFELCTGDGLGAAATPLVVVNGAPLQLFEYAGGGRGAAAPGLAPGGGAAAEGGAFGVLAAPELSVAPAEQGPAAPVGRLQRRRVSGLEAPPLELPQLPPAPLRQRRRRHHHHHHQQQQQQQQQQQHEALGEQQELLPPLQQQRPAPPEAPPPRKAPLPAQPPHSQAAQQRQVPPPPALQRRPAPPEALAPSHSAQEPVRCVRVDAREGLVFELNNRVPHRVTNSGDTERIHLVVDVAEAPRARVALAPGSLCRYSPAGMECEGPGAQGGAGGDGGGGEGGGGEGGKERGGSGGGGGGGGGGAGLE